MKNGKRKTENEFSRTLSLLRQEKGVSQRKAAGSLGISQALLSHYENGTREPGLVFLTKVCDYYGVTADFLLGRTMIRDGSAIQPELLFDASSDKDNRLRGSAAAMLSKRLLCNSISLLFDVLGKAGHRELISAVMRYFSAAFYSVFRIVFSRTPNSAKDFFPQPDYVYPRACRAEMECAEMKIASILSHEGKRQNTDEDTPELPEISNATLGRDYPMLVQSLLSVLHQVGEQLKNFS